jgi:hypothetical protein
MPEWADMASAGRDLRRNMLDRGVHGVRWRGWLLHGHPLASPQLIDGPFSP